MNGRVVIVDDEPITRFDIRDILQGAGYEVVGEAADGFEVIEICKKTRPDVVLMDIQMPNMDGYKATHCIRRLSQPEKANIPIIAMSANAFEEDKKKAFDVKMNDYITKPIDFQKMEQVLKHILSK